MNQAETDISLVTGKLRQLGPADPTVEPGTAVVLKQGALVVAGTATSAGWLTLHSIYHIPYNLFSFLAVFLTILFVFVPKLR